MKKIKLWDQHQTWEMAETAWDRQAEEAAKSRPISKLRVLPQMPGITPDTARNLKWKSLQWMVRHDADWKIFKQVLRRPFRYAFRLLKSMVQSKPYKREGDFFLYGISSKDEFRKLLENREAIFVLGFSYCHKPFECPSGRFTDECIADLDNPVCRQCFIGKAVHAAPENNIRLYFIPTIHYIGEKILSLVHENTEKEILFMITACEMTLEMFGDWGNMAGIKGLGVRLDGRICNTMAAFELSERGIKPGLTVVLDQTQKEMLEIIRLRRDSVL